MNGLEWVTASNTQWLTVMALSGGAFVWIITQTKGKERLMANGLLLAVMAMLFHALYWIVANVFRVDGAMDTAWATYYWMFKVSVVQVSTLGLALILCPLLKSLFGVRFWWLPVAAVSAVSFIAGWWGHLHGL